MHEIWGGVAHAPATPTNPHCVRELSYAAKAVCVMDSVLDFLFYALTVLIFMAYGAFMCLNAASLAYG